MDEVSNTGNTVENGCTKPAAESPKQTLLNTSIIYAEYYNEELLYPSDVLEKWKRTLEIKRSRKDIRKNRSPVRRPANDEPLHEVFKNIMNKDSFSFLTPENNIDDKTPANDHLQMKPREDSIKKSRTDAKNVQKSDQLLSVEKPKQVSTTKKARSLKNKTVVRKLNNNK